MFGYCNSDSDDRLRLVAATGILHLIITYAFGLGVYVELISAISTHNPVVSFLNGVKLQCEVLKMQNTRCIHVKYRSLLLIMHLNAPLTTSSSLNFDGELRLK